MLSSLIGKIMHKLDEALTNLAARILPLARLQLSIVPTGRALEGCLPAHSRVGQLFACALYPVSNDSSALANPIWKWLHTPASHKTAN